MADIIDYKEAKAFIEELDALSAARREEILHSPTTLTVSGTSYYISADGDDAADGLTPETAWKTTEKLDASADLLHAGDGVFFRRGDMFRGGFRARGGVSYSAYGEGAKPIINNSLQDYADASLWEKTQHEKMRESTTFFKDGMRRLFKNPLAVISIVVLLLSLVPTAEYVMRAIDWCNPKKAQ